ncbi:hypothetical protein PanWU01x14_038040, partial [Parasponia andersonii]
KDQVISGFCEKKRDRFVVSHPFCKERNALVTSAAAGNNGAKQETTPQLYSLLDR